MALGKAYKCFSGDPVQVSDLSGVPSCRQAALEFSPWGGGGGGRMDQALGLHYRKER